MTPPKRKNRSGFTLVELLITGAVFSLSTFAVLEVINACARVVRRNAIQLEMDAAAFDLLWCMFNRDYDKLNTLAPFGQDKTFTESGRINLVWDRDLWSGGSPPVMEYTFTMRNEIVDSVGVGKMLNLVYSLENDPNSRRTLELFRSDIPRQTPQ